MIHPCKATLLLALLLLPARVHAVPQQFEIDLKELDRQKPAAAPPRKQAGEAAGKQAPVRKEPAAKKKEPAAKAQHPAKKAQPEARGEHVRYTVQPGDHIFKILVGRFGLSNEAAERLIPQIIELNDIKNIKALEVGRTLLIPAGALREHAPKEAGKEKEKTAKPRKGGAKRQEAAPKAPEPAPAEAPRRPEPAAAAPRAPEPAVTAPRAPEPAAPPAVAALPPVTTWICQVGNDEVGTMIDSLLNAVSATWSRNKIIRSGQGAATPFSIRVDRYFEYKGGRYIVSIGESDPYNYTLIRILETAGYRVLMLTGKEDFNRVAQRFFSLVGIGPVFGSHALREGGHATGFLVRQDDAGGRSVLITNAPLPPGQQSVLPAGCGAK